MGQLPLGRRVRSFLHCPHALQGESKAGDTQRVQGSGVVDGAVKWRYLNKVAQSLAQIFHDDFQAFDVLGCYDERGEGCIILGRG